MKYSKAKIMADTINLNILSDALIFTDRQYKESRMILEGTLEKTGERLTDRILGEFISEMTTEVSDLLNIKTELEVEIAKLKRTFGKEIRDGKS